MITVRNMKGVAQMPRTLEQRLNVMTLYARLEPVCIILALFFGGMFLVTSFSGQPFGIRSVTAVLGLSCIGTIIFFDRYIKHLCLQCGLSPYRIPIHAADYESVCTMLTATPIDIDGCISFRKRKEISVRLLVQNCPDFLPKEVSLRRKALNKRINLRFPRPQSGPNFEVLNRMCINLVVCGQENMDVLSWLQRDPVHLLERNESIVNAAVCLEEQVLLLPAVLDSLNLAQVRKYRSAVELLIGNLAPGVEK